MMTPKLAKLNATAMKAKTPKASCCLAASRASNQIASPRTAPPSSQRSASEWRCSPATPLAMKSTAATTSASPPTAVAAFEWGRKVRYNRPAAKNAATPTATDLTPENRTRHRVRESVQVRVKGERLEQAEALRG